jgi:hypothetical protein
VAHLARGVARLAPRVAGHGLGAAGGDPVGGDVVEVVVVDGRAGGEGEGQGQKGAGLKRAVRHGAAFFAHGRNGHNAPY